MKLLPTLPPKLRPVAVAMIAWLGCAAPLAFAAGAHAPVPAAHAPAEPHGEVKKSPLVDTPAHAEPAPEATPKGTDTLSKLKAVIENHAGKSGNVSLRIGGQVIATSSGHQPETADKDHASESPKKSSHSPQRAKHAVHASASRDYIRAKAAVLSGHAAPEASGQADGKAHEVHWSYEGANGPDQWANLKPEFQACAKGQRQSPVHIRDSDAMVGPAEVLRFDYRPSGGSVVNNGHTIQVDLKGENTLYVRDSAYKLVQFHFHHPAEERVNYKGFSMVAHLVHKNDQGQLAVVAVLIDPGLANPVVEQVWTRMPLDAKDRVGLSSGLIDMNQLLPVDQTYYQFIGSLTTPPCTEGVLWLVMKHPMTVSREQLKLFAHLFPMNARPTQALNERLVREAM